MMTTEDRAHYLIRAAHRAERAGNVRAAGLFRERAAELHPRAVGPALVTLRD